MAKRKCNYDDNFMQAPPDVALQILPDIVIANIISKFNDIKDIQNGLMLSSEIRRWIYADHDTMDKVKYSLIDTEEAESLEFIERRGYCIRRLKLKVDWRTKSIVFMLNKLPRLRELSVEWPDDHINKCRNKIQEISNCSNLRSLSLFNFKDFKDIASQTINLINLTSLYLKFDDYLDHSILRNFIINQHYLQEFSLDDSTDSSRFPYRDISKSVKFHLKRLKISVACIQHEYFMSFLKTQCSSLEEFELEITDSDPINFPSEDISAEKWNLKKLKASLKNVNEENFSKFLEIQAESLKELELSDINSQLIFETILSKLKSLTHLTIDEDGSDIIFSDLFPDLRLESLNYFHDKNQNGTIVLKLFERFPNIETLKCCDLMQATGTYLTLISLYISEVYWPRIKDLYLLNLKNLFIKKIDKCDDDYYWIYYYKSFVNVENITVERVAQGVQDVIRFVKKLRNFKKLKTFVLRDGQSLDYEYKLTENERVSSHEKFFKIIIDVSQKTVKVSTFIARKCKKVMQILRKIFRGFDYFEICFEELKVLRFNPWDLRKLNMIN